MAIGDKYYRLFYSDSGYGVYTEEWTVSAETEKTAIITRPYEEPRRVLKNSSGKRYAYADMASAFDSYRVRKFRQVQHLSRLFGEAKAALEMADAHRAEILAELSEGKSWHLEGKEDDLGFI